MTKRFHGNGFSTEDLSKDELASLRHLMMDVERDWIAVPADVLTAVTDFVKVVSAVRILANVIKIGTPVLITMAAIGWYLDKMGVL